MNNTDDTNHIDKTAKDPNDEEELSRPRFFFAISEAWIGRDQKYTVEHLDKHEYAINLQ